MAQTGYTSIRLYYSTTATAAPSAANLAAGELALNTVDEKLYFKNASGVVKLLAANLTPVANGGTGAATLTGILKGNGTAAFTAAAAGTDYVAPGGALGTPSSGTLTNCTFPTLNQNTTGYASALKSATTTVSVSAATAPTSGQVLTATSGTAATWQTPAAGVSLSGTNTWTGAQTFTNSLMKLLGSSTGVTTFASANAGATNYTITFPASTGTVLTTAAAVTVAQGGTGATTLTGILKGNGTSAFTAASAGTDYVAPGGALGTPSSGTLTNCTFPTLNQNTTGSAATVTTTINSGATGTTQSNGDNTTKIATTAYVQNMGLGWGQTWSDVTASRAIGSTYTNSTGKPILVSVSCEYGSGSYANFNVGAVVVAQGGSNNATIDQNSSQFIVPNGATYSVTTSSGTVTLRRWSELS